MIRPHLGFLFDLALRETGRAQDAEDVVQEVAASALRAPDPELPRAYLAGAVLLRARHLRRGETRRRAREAALLPPRHEELPDRAALVRDEVERALSSLEADDRRAVVLRHLHDLGYDEIGAALGISATAARQRVHRALSRLRERFGSDGEAALALLPLATLPRSLAAKPVLGALLMKMTTKTAVALVALAAGAAVGAATMPRATEVAAEPAPPRPAPPPPAEDVVQLRAEIAKYPPLDDTDLVVLADTSLRGKLAAIDGLPEDARREAVRRIGERIQKSGRGVDEALTLLREEHDPRVLFWLADVLKFLTRNRVALPDRDSYARLAVDGEPAERRRAAVPLAVGSLYEKATPEWESALGTVFERETDPRVLLEAARALTFVWIERPGERLFAAYARMPPGEERRELAVSYRKWAKFEDVVARYDAARDASEREDWVRVVGLQLGQGMSESREKEGEVLRRIYAEQRDARTRAWLVYSWMGNGGKPEDLAPLETDRELRALLERAAALPRDEASRLLKEYFKR